MDVELFLYLSSGRGDRAPIESRQDMPQKCGIVVRLSPFNFGVLEMQRKGGSGGFTQLDRAGKKVHGKKLHCDVFAVFGWNWSEKGRSLLTVARLSASWIDYYCIESLWWKFTHLPLTEPEPLSGNTSMVKPMS